MRVSGPKIGFNIVIIYKFEKETNNCMRYYGEKREKEVGDCLQLCLRDVWSQVDILIKKSLQCPSAAKSAWADIDTQRVELSARCVSTFQLSLSGCLTLGHHCEIRSSNCRCDFRKHSFIDILKKKLQRKVSSLAVAFTFFAFFFFDWFAKNQKCLQTQSCQESAVTHHSRKFRHEVRSNKVLCHCA